jgi:flagellar M-ring protein FliF
MNEKALLWLKQLKAMWDALSMPKRLALIFGTVGVLVGVLLISVVSTRESYTYLFTELSAEDAAAIATKLKETKIPYRLEAGGTAVLVPEEKVHELRLELAGQGLPRGGGVGFEIFDKSHLGATEFEQRIALRRALEGELSRTISTVGAVQTARVHLVLPERSIFAINKEHASASVVLRLRPGRSFGKSEVASVVHLVSSAVPGLSEDHVSIVSADGLTLHRPHSDAAGAGVSSGDLEQQVEQEQALSSKLEEQARSLAEKIVGPGKADVRVGVELDTAVRDRTEEHYEPSKTALRSEQRTDERANGEGATVAGVPGAASNLPDGTAAEPIEGALGSGMLRRSWTRNWEVDRVTEHTTTPAGKLARISVAVLVDGNYHNNEYVPREKAELERIAELIKSSVGFNAARGDVIQVDSVRFAKVDNSDLATPALPYYRRLPWWAYLAALAAALVIGAAIVLSFRGKRRKPLVATRALTAGSQAAVALPAEAARPRLMPDAQALEAARAHALDIAARDPATAAVILREWLNSPTVSSTAHN